MADRAAQQAALNESTNEPSTDPVNDSSNEAKPNAEKVDAGKVDAAFWLAFGRAPTDQEHRASIDFLAAQTLRITSAADDESSTVDVLTGKLPYRDGQAVILDPDSKQRLFRIPHDKRLSPSDFTIEAYFQVRSIYETGAVRMIASSGRGTLLYPVGSFGVTGKGSRRKPQTLVMQIFGETDQRILG